MKEDEEEAGVYRCMRVFIITLWTSIPYQFLQSQRVRLFLPPLLRLSSRLPPPAQQGALLGWGPRTLWRGGGGEWRGGEREEGGKADFGFQATACEEEESKIRP